MCSTSPSSQCPDRSTSGSIEQPLVFGGNDLPGVMLGSGVRRLVNQYRIVPGAGSDSHVAVSVAAQRAEPKDVGGSFLGALVDFVIIALVVYMIGRAFMPKYRS